MTTLLWHLAPANLLGPKDLLDGQVLQPGLEVAEPLLLGQGSPPSPEADPLSRSAEEELQLEFFVHKAGATRRCVRAWARSGPSTQPLECRVSRLGQRAPRWPWVAGGGEVEHPKGRSPDSKDAGGGRGSAQGPRNLEMRHRAGRRWPRATSFWLKASEHEAGGRNGCAGAGGLGGEGAATGRRGEAPRRPGGSRRGGRQDLGRQDRLGQNEETEGAASGWSKAAAVRQGPAARRRAAPKGPAAR